MGHKRNLGKKHSEERNRNNSIAHMGIGKNVPLSEEHRNNISKSLIGTNNPFYGKTHTSEVRQLISKTNGGKTWKVIDDKRVWMEK